MSAKKYTILWKHFEPSSEIGKHLKAKKEFSLPYFVDGEEKIKLEKKEAVELNPFHLVSGLLVGYFDKPPGIDTSFAKETAEAIITEHLPGFKSKSLENLVLDLSNFLRDSHGQTLSIQSLMAGTELRPKSSEIKYDACIDLINCIDNGLLEDRMAAVQQLKLLLSNIDAKKLNPALVNDYHKMIEIANEF